MTILLVLVVVVVGFVQLTFDVNEVIDILHQGEDELSPFFVIIYCESVRECEVH